ncbi:MAG: SUMF1/EgtB/PvdO family nonheme iron enzyme [Filomicrobium sp.]
MPQTNCFLRHLAAGPWGIRVVIDTNTFIIVSVGAVFLTVGVLAWMVDAGVKEESKTLIKYCLFGMFAALIGLFFLIKDDTEFEYGGWTPQDKGNKDSSRRGGMGLGGGGGGRATMSDAGGGGGELVLEEGGEAGEGEMALEEDAGGDGDDDGDGDADGDQANGEIQDCPVCPVIVPIDAGSGLIGSALTVVAKGAQSGPASQVTVKSEFGIGKYEITREQYQAFIDESGYKPTHSCRVGRTLAGSYEKPGFQQWADHPVVCINWRDAVAYTEWLSQKTKKTYRLPTEVEWEFAARSGLTGGYITERPITFKEANFADKKGKRVGRTAKVGSYAANGNKMHDVHGNVWEMTSDCWSPGYLSLKKQVAGKVDCSRHVAKGGAWFSGPEHLNFAMRVGVGTKVANNGLGFRVVRESDTKVIRKSSQLNLRDVLERVE